MQDKAVRPRVFDDYTNLTALLSRVDVLLLSVWKIVACRIIKPFNKLRIGQIKIHLLVVAKPQHPLYSIKVLNVPSDTLE